MADVNFIEFASQPYFIERTSPYIEHYNVRGVQLLPNNPLPYIQTTNVNGGIELEDWTVSVVRCDDKPITIKGSQNLLLQSETTSEAVWVNTNLEIDSDAITVGEYSADRIVATSSNGPHWITQTLSKTASIKTYTISCYVKAAEYSRIYIRLSEGGSHYFITYFNTVNQQFTNTQISGDYTNTVLSYTDEGDGWYRVYATITSSSAMSLDAVFGIVNDSDEYIFVGDNLDGVNLSGLYIRGMQLKEGVLGSYIETTSAAITENDVTTLGTDITDYFTIEEIFTDENGYNQFTWSLKNVPFDFGYDLVYLKAVQTIGEIFYSNYFMFTDYESEKTCRIDYRSYNNDTMQSVQLPMAFKQEFNPVEIESYYETSTKNTVINTVKSQTYESWLTQIISNDLLLKIIKLFTYKYTYVNLIRCNLFEAIEQKEYEAAENFKDNPIKITFNKSDIYDPLAVEIPTVSPLVPEINLVSVITNGSTAYYYFNFANFTPTYFILEYSDDQVNWVTATQVYDTASPKAILFNETGTWYFRMRHPEAESNTITLELGETVEAVDDNISISKGGTIDIPVMFNDVIVGTTTVTAVGTPSNGISTIVESATKVRYVHDGGVSLVDSFTYTISNGITSDTATINISIFATGTAFSININGHVAKDNACSLILNGTKYHNGEGTQPILGDIVYDYSELDIPFNGGNKYYKITGGKAIKIASNGVITDVQFC